MAVISKTCLNKLSQDQQKDLWWRLLWITGREYRRVNSAASVAEWDSIADKSYPASDFTDGDKAFEEYVGKMAAPLLGWLPGWDDTSCSFDQQAYACFAWFLAQSSPEERGATLDLMGKGQDPGDFDCTGKDVASDPIYSTNFPGNRAAPQGTKMWPWLVGIAALGVVGAVVLYDQRTK